MLPRKQTLKRFLASLLLVVVMAVPVLGAAVFAPEVAKADPPSGHQNPSHCGKLTDPDAYYECVNTSGSFADINDFLRPVRSTTAMAHAFFTAETVKNKEPGERKVGIDAGEGGFVAAKGAAIGGKYNGNPFFTLREGEDLYIEGLPPSEYKNVRFVLSAVDYQHKGEGFEKASPQSFGSDDDEGNVYIFSNEFNPAIRLALKAQNTTASSPTKDIIFGDDKARFVYRGDCQGTFSENAWVSNIEVDDNIGSSGTFSPPLTHSDDREDVQQVADGYKNITLCITNKGTFANMVANALSVFQEFLESILEHVTNWVSNIVNIRTLSQNPGLTSAWKTMRDFVNIIFVVVLIAIAFSNIMRIDTDHYGVRALLPRLLFAILAVNFSFLMMQVLTNLAYIISQPFLSKSLALITNPPADTSIINAEAGLGQALVAIIIIGIVIAALAILLLFFIVRILMIWLLTALSPFVFLFMILPMTRSMASQWWDNTIKWIFMAPVAFMILFIAAELVSGGGDLDKSNVRDPNFILKVGFFAAAAFAAVMIPLKIGGNIMERAAGLGRGATRRGGGMGARFAGRTVGRIPTGNGKTLGTRVTAAGMALGIAGRQPVVPGSAAAFRRQAAQEHLASQVGRNQGVGRIAGANRGQRLSALDNSVHEKRKQLNSFDTGSKLRMLHGRAQGLRAGENVVVTDHQGNQVDLGALSREEHTLGNDDIAAAAAFQEMTEAGFATHQMLQGPRSLAFTGYQGRSPDPDIAAYDRQGRMRTGVRDSIASHMEPDTVQGLSTEFHQRVAGEAAHGQIQGDALQSFIRMDGRVLRDARSHDHRNKIADSAKRRAVYDNAHHVLAMHHNGQINLTPEQQRNMEVAAGIGDPNGGFRQ